MPDSRAAANEVRWTGADTFTVGEIEYVCRPLGERFPSSSRHFCLVKDPRHVDWYARMLQDRAPSRMIEVGMWDGGSLALAAQLVGPSRLIGIDHRPTALGPALDEFIAEAGLGARVKPYWGVDQRDCERIASIVRDQLGTELLDLVVDDASHLLDHTRRTFNGLFPRLRQGGVYVIEDWPMHKAFAAAAGQGGTPLSLLIIELLLASADRSDVVECVSVNEYFASVTRGPADLDADLFDLSTCLEPASHAMLETQISQFTARPD